MFPSAAPVRRSGSIARRNAGRDDEERLTADIIELVFVTTKSASRPISSSLCLLKKCPQCPQCHRRQGTFVHCHALKPVTSRLCWPSEAKASPNGIVQASYHDIFRHPQRTRSDADLIAERRTKVPCLRLRDSRRPGGCDIVFGWMVHGYLGWRRAMNRLDHVHGWFSDNKEWIEYIIAALLLWLLMIAAISGFDLRSA